MRGIIKALILGWIGKKIYDRVTEHEPESEPERTHAKKPTRSAAHAKSAPRRTRRKPTRRAA
jgi:hypothetical protein